MSSRRALALATAARKQVARVAPTSVICPDFAAKSPARPFIIPHNGNTLRGMQYCMESIDYMIDVLGLRVIDLDIQLSIEPDLLCNHDATGSPAFTTNPTLSGLTAPEFRALTLDRTVFDNGNGTLTPVTLPDVLKKYGHDPRGIFFCIEAKGNSGQQIVELLLAHGIPTTRALVQANDVTRLSYAVAAGYPAMKIWVTGDTPQGLLDLGVNNVALPVTNADSVFTTFIAAGLGVSAYPCVGHWMRDHYTGLGCSILHSDDASYTAVDSPQTGSDTWKTKFFMGGQLPSQGENDLTARNRGRVAQDGSGWFGFSSYFAEFRSCLLGDFGPIKWPLNPENWTADWFMKWDQAAAASSFGGVSFSGADTNDLPFVNTGGRLDQNFFYPYVKHDGKLGIQQILTGTSSNITEIAGTAMSDGLPQRFRLTKTGTTVRFQRLALDGKSITHDTGNKTISASLNGKHVPSLIKSSTTALISGLWIR